jgi:hypothetical protein
VFITIIGIGMSAPMLFTLTVEKIRREYDELVRLKSKGTRSMLEKVKMRLLCANVAELSLNRNRDKKAQAAWSPLAFHSPLEMEMEMKLSTRKGLLRLRFPAASV